MPVFEEDLFHASFCDCVAEGKAFLKKKDREASVCTFVVAFLTNKHNKKVTKTDPSRLAIAAVSKQTYYLPATRLRSLLAKFGEDIRLLLDTQKNDAWIQLGEWKKSAFETWDTVYFLGTPGCDYTDWRHTATVTTSQDATRLQKTLRPGAEFREDSDSDEDERVVSAIIAAGRELDTCYDETLTSDSLHDCDEAIRDLDMPEHGRSGFDPDHEYTSEADTADVHTEKPFELRDMFTKKARRVF